MNLDESTVLNKSLQNALVANDVPPYTVEANYASHVGPYPPSIGEATSAREIKPQVHKVYQLHTPKRHATRKCLCLLLAVLLPLLLLAFLGTVLGVYYSQNDSKIPSDDGDDSSGSPGDTGANTGGSDGTGGGAGDGAAGGGGQGGGQGGSGGAGGSPGDGGGGGDVPTTPAPPLKCFYTSERFMEDFIHAVTNPNTMPLACVTSCFSIKKVVLDTGLRTCDGTVPSTFPTRGCRFDTDIPAAICACQTWFCNALSMDAQAVQLLHYTFDDGFEDLSDQDDQYNGTAPVGFTLPQRKCDDAVHGCSAWFTGQNCLVADGLHNWRWGTYLSETVFFPELSLSFWIKTYSVFTTTGGIIGNSLNSSVSASWKVDLLSADTLRAGIVTSGATGNEMHFTDNIQIEPDTWHHVLLRYSGRVTASHPLPTLDLYIDSQIVSNQELIGSGEVLQLNESVTVGCVENEKGFVGLLDDVRVFTGQILDDDITALKLMLEKE